MLITVVLFVLMGLIFARLFTLTILQGDSLKEASDTKRIKEVKTTAPRGNIYDRNGRLLAGTRTTFTVQLINDELRTVPMEERNPLLLQLVRRLEEDGVPYQDEYDILLNAFTFTDPNQWFLSEDSPEDIVLQRLQEGNHIGALLRSYYVESGDALHFKFAPAQLAIKALDQKGVTLPIDIALGDKEFTPRYLPGREYNESAQKYELTEDNPIGDVERLVKNDESILRKMLSHPIVRQMAFDLLRNAGKDTGISLAPMALREDLNLLDVKGSLHRNFPSVTVNTSAKQDFVTVAEGSVLPTLFSRVYKGENTTVVPADLAIAALDQKDIDHGLTTQIHGEQVDVQFADPAIQTSDNPMDRLIALSIEHQVNEAIVTRDDLKADVQAIILAGGINPRILVSTWQYVYEKERIDITEALDLPENATAEQVFAARETEYKMQIASRYEAVGVQSLHHRIDQIGHYGYEPLNIAYNLSDDTVAYLEETVPNNKGIQISVEPVRFYPQGTTAAHALGYVGRIATQEELDRFNENTGYSPNDIIGKTGIEESYENVLKGKDGQEVVQVDVMGNRTQTLSKIDPVPGDNVFLTIDYDLQRVTEDALTQTLDKLKVGGTFTSDWGNWQLFQKDDGSLLKNANSGSTVVLDVKTGEVLAMANYKPYDPNLFSTGISNTDWESLFPEDERDLLANRPLLNIATQSEVQPGSIFKLVTSYAALEKGQGPYSQIEDSGYITIGDTDFGCWIWNEVKGNHGMVDMAHALMHSCNYYFYALALGRNDTTGVPTDITLTIEDIEKATQQFGLDQPTGIEINTPQEASGQIPDPVAKIETISALMKEFLVENLSDYEDPKNPKANSVRNADIESIVAWVDEPELLTRQEVSDRLSEMGYVAETPLPGNVAPLTDILKFTYINQATWDITDTLNVVIGQGQNAYTPIQMANMVATISNGGVRNKTTLFSKSMNYNNTTLLASKTYASKKIEMREEGELQYIIDGMELAGSYGSVGQIFGTLPISVGTKTGTAERAGVNPVTGEYYDDYGWFVAFAPLDDPQIAVATVLFQGGSGSNAAPMTREIIASYLKLYPEQPLDEIEPSTEREE